MESNIVVRKQAIVGGILLSYIACILLLAPLKMAGYDISFITELIPSFTVLLAVWAFWYLLKK